MTGPAGDFPSVLSDGEEVRLAVSEMTQEMPDGATFKAALYDGPTRANVQPTPHDRIWPLPDSLGDPPQSPGTLADELVEGARAGGAVAVLAWDEALGAMVFQTLQLRLDEAAGRA